MSDAANEPERADPVVPGRAERGMVDAEDFLAFTQRLHEVHARVDSADAADRRRSGWQRRLLAITETARTSLERARQQLDRLEAELDEQLDDRPRR